MNVHIVYAHPEPKSLNGSLKNLAVETLISQGHEVRVSDLYEMRWKAVADAEDFRARTDSQRLFYASESKHAYLSATQSLDVELEQQLLLWADAVILQFPLWWYSAPAILKGWIERVYAYGFAYGVGVHEGEHWGDRYGEGTLLGRRALVSITAGGREPHYSRRGIDGSIEDLLWPLQHGTLYYPGMDVLPPFVIYDADDLTLEDWPGISKRYKARLESLFTEAPIKYRRQNGGHYDSQQILKEGLGAGESGLRMHLLQPDDPPQRPIEIATEYTTDVA